MCDENETGRDRVILSGVHDLSADPNGFRSFTWGYTSLSWLYPPSLLPIKICNSILFPAFTWANCCYIQDLIPRKNLDLSICYCNRG